MAVIKNDLKSIVEDRLRNYPVISKHLGGIISIDVKYWNVEHSVLLKTLIERDTKPRAKFHLDRLENALRLGEKHCANFELIFKNIESEYRRRGEARLLDTLAEVRAFEFMLNIGCSDIAHLHREQGRTVDFTASRQGTRYAVEVTRLNLPDSEKKKPIKMLEAYLSDGRKFDMISVNDNVEPFRYTLQTCVEREYRQLTEYIEGQNAEYSGLVIISAGIDYLVPIRRVRTELHALRDEWRDILASVFDYLKESGRYSNLHGIFLIVAEKEDRIYSCPELGDI